MVWQKECAIYLEYKLWTSKAYHPFVSIQLKKTKCIFKQDKATEVAHSLKLEVQSLSFVCR